MAAKHKPMKPQTWYSVIWPKNSGPDRRFIRNHRSIVALSVNEHFRETYNDPLYDFRKDAGRIIKLRVTEVRPKKRSRK